MAIRPWEPILQGRAVDRAWQVIEHVAHALRHPPAPYDGAIADDALRASLFAREAGFAVFYSYLARARSEAHEARELGARFLAEAVDRIDAIATERPQFAYGFSGTAWAVEHVGAHLDDDPGDGDDVDDPLASIDDALAELVDAKPADAPFMLNTGLVGYAAYALERMPQPSARRLLVAVVDKLVAGAELDGDGACWRMRGAWMVAASGEPTDEHHTGIRSGVAGPIAVLGAARRWGIASDRSDATLERALAWLARRDAGLDRLGYADGAAGTAAAVWAACSDERAHQLGIAAAARTDASGADSIARRAGRLDVSLESGVAGSAHAFARLAHATGDPTLRDAARRWFEAVLDAYDPAVALGGYRFHIPAWEQRYDVAIPTGHRELPGISFGVAGVALALLGAITPIEPAWDRMFLLSAREATT